MQHSYTELLEATIENKIRAFVNTNLIAKVVSVSFFEEKQFVDVQPLILQRFGPEGDERALDTSIIYSVPMVFPAGGGGMLSFPTAVGDDVLILITKRDIADWLESDGDYVSEPDTDRFNLTDAIAIPSIYTSQTNLTPSATNVELKIRDMHLVLDDEETITLGNSTSTLKITEDNDLTLSNENNKIEILNDNTINISSDDGSTTIVIGSDNSITMTNPLGEVGIEPTGRIFGENANNTLELNPDGSSKLENPLGGIQVLANGKVSINGVIFDTSGNIEEVGDISSTSGSIELDAGDITAINGNIEATEGDFYVKTPVSPSTPIPLGTHIHTSFTAPPSGPP